MLAMNFLGEGQTANYLDTGVWTTKAIKEAKKLGNVHLAFDGSMTNYDHCPSEEELTLAKGAAYLHFCSNNTIYGTRFTFVPKSDSPVICDMSSDMFSRSIDWDSYDMVYAGAQKNVGPAGATIVIIREDLLERVPDGLHTMLDYRTHAEKGSLYNTPPVFSIYVIKLVTDWILSEFGGLERIAASNEEQAAMLYSAIDRSEGFYMGHAIDDCRSRMNVTWRLRDEGLETKFIEEARKADLHGLKGHRSVGGIRASIYNAMTSEGVAALAEFMVAFREQEA